MLERNIFSVNLKNYQIQALGPKPIGQFKKKFLNRNQFPIIPPVFHLNKFITDFQENATLFNNFFASQCTVLDTGNQLPFFMLLLKIC